MPGVACWCGGEKIGEVRLLPDGSLEWDGDDRLKSGLEPIRFLLDGEDLLRYLLKHSGSRVQYLPVEDDEPASPAPAAAAAVALRTTMPDHAAVPGGFHIHLPPTTIQVTMPEQPAAVINVNVPEQPAAVVNVSVPPQPPAAVNVAPAQVTVMPAEVPPPRFKRVVRDDEGNIVGTQEE